MDYMQAYCKLFNGITDAIKAPQQAQIEAGTMMMEEDSEAQENGGDMPSKPRWDEPKAVPLRPVHRETAIGSAIPPNSCRTRCDRTPR